MDGTKSMNEQELLKASATVLRHPDFKFLRELLLRRQATQIKAICSLGDPIEIYRSQGKVKGYDAVLSLEAEIKTLK